MKGCVIRMCNKATSRKADLEKAKKLLGGEKAYKQKCGNYIDRDYSNVFPGECYVSAHAQLNVLITLANKKTCFPWVTAWVDFRTGKWLSWNLHAEDPGLDRVILTFRNAVDKYGIPHLVYMDNGKDYRVSGGRKRNKKVSLSLDDGKSRTALGILGTEVIFGNPYSPQSKSIIERSFRKVKEGFSKFMTDYGTLEEVTELFDNFIINVLNKTPGNGKILNGMSPDELWEKGIC